MKNKVLERELDAHHFYFVKFANWVQISYGLFLYENTMEHYYEQK